MPENKQAEQEESRLAATAFDDNNEDNKNDIGVQAMPQHDLPDAYQDL